MAGQADDYGNKPSGVGNAVFRGLEDAGAPPLWDATASVAGEGVGGGMVTGADTGKWERGEGLKPMDFVGKSGSMPTSANRIELGFCGPVPSGQRNKSLVGREWGEG